MRTVIVVLSFLLAVLGPRSAILADDRNTCRRIETHLEQMRAEADAAVTASMGSPFFGKLCSDAVGGDADAQFQIAEFFRKGWFAPRDDAEAYRWYEAASEGGNLDARAWMGIRLMQGRGVDRDVERGLELVEASAADKSPMGMRIYGNVLQSGLSSEERKTVPNFKEDRDRGTELIREAALAGDPDAAYQMAIWTGRDGHTPESEEWLQRAAAGDNSHAQFGLASGILNGRFGPPDKQLYLQMLVRAAVNGNPTARGVLAGYFQFGTQGLPLDYRMAEFWYRRAAELGSLDAERQLAKRDQWGAMPERQELTAGEVWAAGFVALVALGIVMNVVDGSGEIEGSGQAVNTREGLDAACHMMTPMEMALAGCQ